MGVGILGNLNVGRVGRQTNRIAAWAQPPRTATHTHARTLASHFLCHSFPKHIPSTFRFPAIVINIVMKKKKKARDPIPPRLASELTVEYTVNVVWSANGLRDLY